MKIALSALLLLCMIGLTAQSSSSDISQLRQQVAQNPTDSYARLTLAYELMLIAQTKEALNHYETLLRQQPQNVLAAEGILWALQAQMRYRESILKAEQLLISFPAHAPLYNYRAYGYSQRQLHLSSRRDYATAERLALSDAPKDIARAGLAWEYLFLKNYPAAKAVLSVQGNKADPLAQKLMDKPHALISLGAGTDYQGKHNAKLSASLQRAEWSLNFSAEELVLDGARFRGIYGLSAGWQSPLGHLSASKYKLWGEDKRVYPASLISLSFRPIFYIGKLQLNPSLAGVYSHYERFDIQQADCGIQAAGDYLAAGYTLSVLYQDNEAMDSDRQKQLHSLNIGIRLASQIWLTAYLYEGKQAWWTNPYGTIYDSFEADNRAYGFSLSSPLSQSMGILLYHQIGVRDHETQHSSFITLSYHI